MAVKKIVSSPKAAAKQVKKPAAGKVSLKKPAAEKKVLEKKAPAKTVAVKKPAAKKLAVKKVPVKKVPAKEVPAKKTATKKAVVKKAAIKLAAVKKAVVKKVAVKKAVAKTATKSLISETQKALLARLTDAIPHLDEESLEALVHSAENLAESCRQDIMREEARAAESQGMKPGANPMNTTAGMPAPLTIEVSEDKRFFHIVVDGKWKMLDQEELKILVRIASDTDPESELRTRMFTWLKRERSDILNDLGISTAVSPILAELMAYLKKNFKVMD